MVSLDRSHDITNNMTRCNCGCINYTIEEFAHLSGASQSSSALVVKASNQAQHVSSELLTAAPATIIKNWRNYHCRFRHDWINQWDIRYSTESAKVAQTILATAKRGTLAVRESIAGMSEIRTYIQDTSKRIKRLEKVHRTIGEIVCIDYRYHRSNQCPGSKCSSPGNSRRWSRAWVYCNCSRSTTFSRAIDRSKSANQQINPNDSGDTQDAIAAMERSTLGVRKRCKTFWCGWTALEEIEEVSKQLARLVTNIFDITNTQTQAANKVCSHMEEILHITRQTTEGTLQTTTSVKQITGFACWTLKLQYPILRSDSIFDFNTNW